VSKKSVKKTKKVLTYNSKFDIVETQLGYLQ